MTTRARWRGRTTANRAFDLIESDFRPFLSPSDPFGWPMKVRALASDPYTFWRGSKAHFYQWARDACTDWLSDRSRFIPTHGDPHFGNVGSYPSAEGFGQLAIGLVDFDETALLPPEFDLLQGAIMIRLAAGRARIPWTERISVAISETIVAAYPAACASDRTATDLLAGNPLARSLLRKAETPYEQELQNLTEQGRFRSLLGKGEVPSDVLRRLDAEAKELVARGLAQASAAQPRLLQALRQGSVESLHGSIVEIALRTRLKSSGSQGLAKIFVLMRAPLADVEHDAVLYLKEQVLAPAERFAVAAPVAYPPGKRAATFAAALCRPPIYLNGWVWAGASTFQLSLREPWSDEVDASSFKTRDDLLEATELWATVLGAAHHHAGMKHARWMSAERWRQIDRRAADYLALHRQAFDDFASDSRTQALTQSAEAAVGNLAGAKTP